MTSAQELRRAVAASRNSLRAAIASASDRWVLGTDEHWGPRAVAEHCVETEAEFAARVAVALRWKGSTGSSKRPLESAADAFVALEAAFAEADAVFREVNDGDLAKPAEMSDESAEFFGRTVESVLRLSAVHIEVHAQQIADA